MKKGNKIIFISIWLVLICSLFIAYKIFFVKEQELTEEEKIMKNLNINKIEDYLYSIDFDNYSYEYGMNTLNKMYDIKLGGCSAVKNGNYFGRNYDWYYDENAEFIINVPKKENRHASVGVSYGLLKNDEIDKNSYKEEYELLPFLTMDGVNDAGVAVTINVVTTGDRGYTTGTNPDGDYLITTMIPRFVLDNAESVDEAIELLSQKNIYTPLTEKMAQEVHFMIVDKNKTAVVEFINNKMVVLYKKNIMTNFYLTDFDENNLPNHAMGIERYNILKDGYDQSNTKDGMINLMKQVYYSKSYDFNNSPFWYSEFSGVYKGVDLTTKNQGEPNLNGDLTKAGAYQQYFERINELYKNKTRNKTFWHTTHMSVYDLNKKTLTVIAQENNKEFNFKIK